MPTDTITILTNRTNRCTTIPIITRLRTIVPHGTHHTGAILIGIDKLNKHGNKNLSQLQSGSAVK